jgi:winged helix DNA-binding protein
MKARSRAASSSTTTSRPIRSVRGAAAWVDRVGIASLLPVSDVVLPSLWQQVAGTLDVEWGVQRADGKFEFTPEMARCWDWKDELPALGLACVGKHLGRWQALVAPRLVPALRATRTTELTPIQREIVEAVRSAGASTPGELRVLVGAEKKTVDAAVIVLQRALVLTNSHLVEQQQGWPAIAVDLVERKWPARKLPEAAVARRELASTVLAACGELSAADLGGALGWRLKQSREVLDELGARVRVENGVALYSPV